MTDALDLVCNNQSAKQQSWETPMGNVKEQPRVIIQVADLTVRIQCFHPEKHQTQGPTYCIKHKSEPQIHNKTFLDSYHE